jgi:hypothetical protein
MIADEIYKALPLDILQIIYNKVKTRYDFLSELLTRREIVLLLDRGRGLVDYKFKTNFYIYCPVFYSDSLEYEYSKRYTIQLLKEYKCVFNTDYVEVWQKNIKIDGIDKKFTIELYYEYYFDSHDDN